MRCLSMVEQQGVCINTDNDQEEEEEEVENSTLPW